MTGFVLLSDLITSGAFTVYSNPGYKGSVSAADVSAVVVASVIFAVSSRATSVSGVWLHETSKNNAIVTVNALFTLRSIH